MTARPRMFGAVAFAALLVLSACGGGSGGGVASAGGDRSAASSSKIKDTARLDADAQALVFAECMRDNGVDMPDPGPGQQGLGRAIQGVSGDHDRQSLQQAIAACQDLMPQFAHEEHGDDVMLELAECLRKQGLDVSDNPFGDMHAGDIDQKKLTAAMEICRDLVTGPGR